MEEQKNPSARLSRHCTCSKIGRWRTIAISLIGLVILFFGFAQPSRAEQPPLVVKTFPMPGNAPVPKNLKSPATVTFTIAKLKPLHRTLGKPEPGEWLDGHQEKGQSFRQYCRIRPATPTGRRAIIYVQPIGDFSDSQRRIVELSAEYLGIYFNRPSKILVDLPIATIPAKARRVHPEWKVKQILTTYVLDELLASRLPADAAVYIGFTGNDLWPGDGWNFVFGQASFRKRVGVWSIFRNGDPTENEESFRRCLSRTLKTATHETGHMFSIQHCTAYQCNMCGSNHREESDKHPLYLCPECHAKICWATGANPRTRFGHLAKFCEQHGLASERDYFKQAQNALK